MSLIFSIISMFVCASKNPLTFSSMTLTVDMLIFAQMKSCFSMCVWFPSRHILFQTVSSFFRWLKPNNKQVTPAWMTAVVFLGGRRRKRHFYPVDCSTNSIITHIFSTGWYFEIALVLGMAFVPCLTNGPICSFTL